MAPKARSLPGEVTMQQPVSEIEQVMARGREAEPCSPHNRYLQGVTDFRAAVAGHGSPAATGEAGVASLAVALAVREAARNGQRQSVKVRA